MMHKTLNPDSECTGTAIVGGKPSRGADHATELFKAVTFQTYRCLKCGHDLRVPIENVKALRKQKDQQA